MLLGKLRPKKVLRFLRQFVTYKSNSAMRFGCFRVVFWAICPLEAIAYKIFTEVFPTDGICVSLRKDIWLCYVLPQLAKNSGTSCSIRWLVGGFMCSFYYGAIRPFKWEY